MTIAGFTQQTAEEIQDTGATRVCCAFWDVLRADFCRPIMYVNTEGGGGEGGGYASIGYQRRYSGDSRTIE